MKCFDFGAFQNKVQLPSHEKIIFHMLFEAFRKTVSDNLTATAMLVTDIFCLRHLSHGIK